MLRVNNVFGRVDDISCDFKHMVAEKLGIPTAQICSLKLARKSIDARKKRDVRFCYSFLIEVENKSLERKLVKQNSDVQETSDFKYEIPKIGAAINTRPVVIGFGPAGMFCAYVLAKAGLKPIVIERGSNVEKRKEDVELFRSKGILNEESNVQFGEGGAGTFSDGKLNTGIKDKRINYVLETFHRFGAQESILTDAKPHIGTDILSLVVKRIRNEIISLGGEVLFDTLFLSFDSDNGRVKSITIRDSDGLIQTINTDYLVLAIGHSARDTVQMLLEKLEIDQKAFSIGVRIEHKQSWLNELQYGRFASYLPPADYKINCITEKGRGVYSFCMCPGGYVVASSSEKETIVTNGMSYSDRSGDNCNAAILVSVTPDDFPGENPMAGFELQKSIERKAYVAGGGGYIAPSQRVASFLGLKDHSDNERIKGTYLPGSKCVDLCEVFPEFIVEALKDAIKQFDKKMPGFANPDALLTAPETRSSSPVRIKREKNGESTKVKGIYPCGEGAGYAGGITSSAVDGIKTAESIIYEITKE